MTNEISYICPKQSSGTTHCGNRIEVSEATFRSVSIPGGTIRQHSSLAYNCIIFLLEGKMELSIGSPTKTTLNKREMIMVEESSYLTTRAIESCEIIVFQFTSILNSCDKINLQSYVQYCDPKTLTPSVMPVMEPLVDFLNLAIRYNEYGLFCKRLNEIKHTEFFYLLHCLYAPQQIAQLFRPIIGHSLNFRQMILRYYPSVGQAADLVELSGMSKSVFYRKFKAEFGVSAKQWMLHNKLEQILILAMEPEISVKELMQRCGYESYSYFSRFCQQHLNCKPKELIESKKLL